MKNAQLQFFAEHGNILAIEPSAMYAAFAAGERKGRLPRVSGGVAVMPLHGMLTQRGRFFGTSTDRFGAAFDSALANSDIGAIVLDVDSPGGVVFGTPELSQKIHDSRGGKPIIAVANSTAASAAYWIASSADTLIVTPSGEVGSIGVWMAHIDESEWLAKEGMRVSLVAAGKYKTEGNPWEPLSDEARAEMQRSVDAIYEDFAAAVARNFGVNKSQVKSDFGDGRMLESSRAVSAGMAHGVDTLDSVVGRMASKSTRGRRADADLTGALCAAWEGELSPKTDHPPVEQLAAMRKAKEKRFQNAID